MMEYIARRGHQRRQVLTRFRHTALAAHCARYISPQACESRLRSSAGCKEAQRASNCGDSAGASRKAPIAYASARKRKRKAPIDHRFRNSRARALFPLIGKALPCFDQSSRSLSSCARPLPSPRHSSSGNDPVLRTAPIAAPWRRSPATIRSAIRSGKACRPPPRLSPIGTDRRCRRNDGTRPQGRPKRSAPN